MALKANERATGARGLVSRHHNAYSEKPWRSSIICYGRRNAGEAGADLFGPVLFSEQASLEDPISKSHKLDPSSGDRFNKSELLIASGLIPEVRGVGMGKGASVLHRKSRTRKSRIHGAPMIGDCKSGFKWLNENIK